MKHNHFNGEEKDSLPVSRLLYPVSRFLSPSSYHPAFCPSKPSFKLISEMGMGKNSFFPLVNGLTELFASIPQFIVLQSDEVEPTVVLEGQFHVPFMNDSLGG
jgi:hypothetical protein